MASASKVSTGRTSPGILLLEEYDAIATAISSALKKFAPKHQTVVANSLGEARKISKRNAPDLFVIDFDPAYAGLTEFLEQAREAYPGAKVLVIAPGVSAELAAERRSFGALQFLEKPFEVADFGAAVQALLGPWKESDSAHSRGTLRSLNLPDIVLLQCAGGRTVTIAVKANHKKTGEVHVRNGQLSHAETGELAGVDALEEMFTWPEVRMAEADKSPSRRRTIKGPWEAVFLEACRQVQAQPPVRIPPAKATVPPKEAAALKPQPKPGKKIVVIDDTEMLLIFVEDVLATSDPDLQITTALNGTSGIKAIERIMPDLVLLDYSLPDFNGDEVCRRLLQNEETERIPVLMMSGHVAEMSQAAASLDNVVATIEKPFLSEALSVLVQQTLHTKPQVARKKALAGVDKKGITAGPLAVPDPTAPEPQQPGKAEQFALENHGVSAEPTIPVPAQSVEQPAEARVAPSVADDRRAAFTPTPTGAPPVQLSMPPTEQPAVEKPTVPAIQIPKPDAPRSPTITSPLTPHIDAGATPGGVESHVPRAPTISLPVASTEPNDVVLGLFLEVVSMQLTESLRMGAIRAKPSSGTVSLHAASPALRASFPANGFQLGPVEVDKDGRIITLRLIPTLQPFTPLQTRNALQIGGVAVVPANSREHVELKPSLNAPMRVQLLAHLELAGVELSTTFQVSQLVLKSRARTVRVTFSSDSVAQEQSGATCEAADVQLDESARIAELLLQPVH